MNLRNLQRGDRVIIGDRTKPVGVVDLGVRTVVDERIPKRLETPLVRVQGDWDDAVERVLAYKLNRFDGERPVLEELETIVACESDDLERGDIVTVQRTETASRIVSEVVGGARGDA